MVICKHFHHMFGCFVHLTQCRVTKNCTSWKCNQCCNVGLLNRVCRTTRCENTLTHGENVSVIVQWLLCAGYSNTLKPVVFLQASLWLSSLHQQAVTLLSNQSPKHNLILHCNAGDFLWQRYTLPSSCSLIKRVLPLVSKQSGVDMSEHDLGLCVLLPSLNPTPGSVRGVLGLLAHEKFKLIIAKVQFRKTFLPSDDVVGNYWWQISS